MTDETPDPPLSAQAQVERQRQVVESEERTSPTLHFLTARAYHRSARNLMLEPIPRLNQRDAPIRALFHHAAELYLKAFLLAVGVRGSALRKQGHDYERLVERTHERGLELTEKTIAVLTLLQQLGAFHTSRYPTVGRATLIHLDEINNACNELAALTGRRVFPTLHPNHRHNLEPV